MSKIRLTNAQMNVMLVAVEHGYKQCEKGANLQTALGSVHDMYEVEDCSPGSQYHSDVAQSGAAP